MPKRGKKMRNIFKTYAAKIRILFALAATGTIATLPAGFCSTSTTDISSVVLEWMPLIITFAMLGMILGLLKKFGKF